MDTYDIVATLSIKVHGEGKSAQAVLANALKTKDYEILSSTLGDVSTEPTTQDDYISLKEYALRSGFKNSTYLRLLCKEGKVPGAVMIGRIWCVPADSPAWIDRRVHTGKYVGSGHYEKYVKPRKQKAKENTEDTEE